MIRNLLPPIGFITVGFIPTKSIASCLTEIIPAAIIPQGMSAIELVAQALQIISLIVGISWIILQFVLKYPEIKKRLNGKKKQS